MKTRLPVPNYSSRFFLCAWLALAAIPALAIVNVEQAIIGQASEGIHSTVDLLANGAAGNTDKSASKAELLTLWQHGTSTEYAQMQYAYGKSRGQVDTDKAFLHLRHRAALTQDWSTEEFVQFGRDPFARLTQRTLLGGGARWVLFEENKRSAGYLGFGAFRELETLSDRLGTNDPKSVALWRANSYLVLKRQLNEQVRVYSTTFYQPSVSHTADYRVLEQVSMLVKLDQHLDLKLSLDIAFDSQPPQTVQKRDLFYSTGIEFAF